MSIGQRYIDFINPKNVQTYFKNPELLFSQQVRKVVNSAQLVHNINELVEQMQDVTQKYGVVAVNLLDLIEAKDNTINVIRFEITYVDHTVDCVIAILKGNKQGLIYEINDVFGEKAAYDWKS